MPHTLTQATLAAALLMLAACADTPRAPVPAPVPAPPVPVAAAPTPVVGDRALPIFFESWSALLEDPVKLALREAAERIKANPRLPVLVVGYASPRGSAEATMLLSRVRARVVADALIENGVPAGRVRVVYRGATPGFEALESRRVEVRLDRG